MSQTIDQKVVEMKFDNSNFESNVKQSMSTLDQLKKDLDLEKSAESLKQLTSAADNVSFDGLNRGMEDVKVHFSALETVATAALATITNQAVNTGIAMAKSLSIDLTNAGFSQYERKTQSVQTIMNATGKDIDTVNEALDRLIWFADETSYSFGDMVDNVGKFTSVGVDLDVASKAMMGISNWAAVSGQNAQTATRAMYNLSQAMGLGYVGLMDWKSIELANMATSEFKQQVIDTAVAMGKLNKGEVTTTNFRESLKDKWFDNDVLLAVLGKYGDYTELVYNRVKDTGELCAEAMNNVAKEMGGSYDAIGEKALRAAQEAKTFHEAVEATSDAVKSQWATLFENIFGNYDEAKETFTNLANSLWEVFAAPLSSFNETVSEAMGAPKVDLSQWNNLKDSLKENLGLTSDGLLEFEEILKQVAKDSGLDVDSILASQGNFAAFVASGYLDTDMIQEAYKRIQNGTADTSKSLEDFQKVVTAVWNGEYGNGEERRSLLEAAGYDPDEIQRLVNLGKDVQLTMDDVGASSISLSEDLKKLVENGASVEEFQSILQSTSGDELRNGFWNNLFSADDEKPGAIVKYVTTIRDAFSDIFGTLDSGSIHNVLVSLYEGSLKLIDEDRVARFKKAITNIFHAIHSGFNLVKGAFSVVKAAWDNTLGPLLSGLWDIVKSIASGIGDLFSEFDSVTGKTSAFATAVDWLNRTLEPVKRGIQAVTGGISEFISLLFSGKSVVDSFKIAFDNALNVFFGSDVEGQQKKEKFLESFQEIIDKLVKVKDTIVDIFNRIGNIFKDAYNTFAESDLGKAIFDIVGKVRDALTNAWQSIRDWFDNTFGGDADFSVIDSVQSGLDNFKEWLDNFSLSEGVQKVSDGIYNFGENVKTKFGEVKEWIDNNETLGGIKDGIKNKFDEVKDAFNEGQDNSQKEPLLTRILDGIKSVLQWILDNMPSLTDVIHMFTALVSGSAVVSLVEMIQKVKSLFSGGSGIANGISKVLNGVGRALNSFALEMTGEAIWDMAKSFALVMGVVVGGLVALTLVDQNKLATAGIVMLGVGAGVAALAKAFVEITKTLKENKQETGSKKIGEAISDGIDSIASGVKNYLTVTAYASAIQKVAIAIALLSASMLMLSKLSWEDIGKGLLTVAALLAEVVLSIKAMGSEKQLMVDMNALLGISGAVMMFVESFKEIAKYDWEEIFKGVVTIGAILLECTVFMRYAGDLKVSSGVAMIGVAASMLLFCSSIKKIAAFEPMQLLQAVLAIGAIMAEMTIALKYSDGVKVSTMAGMIAIAVSMLIFTKSIKDLANYSWDKLLFSVLAIGAVLAEIVGFAKLMENISISIKAMALALVLAIAIRSFSKSIQDLSQYNWTQLLASVLAIGAVMAEMVLFAKLFQGIEMSLKEGAAIAAVSAAVLSFALALKLLSTIPWPSLLAGAAAIAGILLSIAGAAVLLDKVQGSVDHITKLLLAIAGVIAAVAAAIWLVTKALDGADLSSVQVNLGELVTTLVTNIVQGIVGSIGSIVQGIVDLFSQLVENAPQIVDMALTFIITVLDKLSERLPELASSLANFCSVLMTSLADAFQNIDLTPLASVLQNMLIATIGLALVGKFGSFVSITKGIGMMAEVIAAFGLIIAAFGALNLIPGFTEFMAGGVDALCVIADGIGQFVGTLAGSAAESFTSSLPAIGTYLSEFMTNVQGFVDGMGSIKGDFLESIGALSLAMLEITGANFVDTVLNGLSALFGGGSSEDFMKKFVDLGNALSEFAASISGVDFSAVDGATNAATVLGTLLNIVPRSGGLLQSIIGEKDLEGIDIKFGNLGRGVANFCRSLTGVKIDESSAAAADTAATIIQNLMDKAVPATGGLWQKIVGEKDIGSAGDNFSKIGHGVKAFCSAIEGITVDQVTVTTAGMAADIIAQLMDKKVQQNEGGLWQKIVGQSNVSSAEANFTNVGKGLAAFCQAIDTITVDQVTVTTAGMAADIIADIMDKSVNAEGGLWQKIVGEKDTGNAGENFANIGEGLAAFCTSISTITIDQTTVETAGMAADAVALIMEKGVSGQGGLWQKIVGEKDMTNAGTNFQNIGEGLAAFCIALDGVTVDQVTVTTAGMAAEILKDLMGSDAVVTDNGLWQRIVGVKDPSSAPENFKDLGMGVANFCQAIEGVTIDQTSVVAAGSAAGIIKALMEVAPKTDGLLGWLTGGNVDFSKFGTDLTNLGLGIANFTDGIKDISQAEMDSGKIAAQGIIDIFNLGWPEGGGLIGWIVNGIAGGGTDFEELKTTLGTIGEMALTVSEGFANVSIENINFAKQASQSIIDVLSLEWPVTDTGFLGMIGNALAGGNTNWSTLGQELKDMGSAIKGFSDSVTGIDATSSQKAYWCGWVITQLVDSLPSDMTKLDDIETYGDNVKTFGERLAAYSSSVSTMNFETVDKSVAAVESLIATIESMSSVDFANATSFSDALGDLASSGVNDFADTFSNAKETTDAAMTTFMSNVITYIEGCNADFVTAGNNALDSYKNGFESVYKLISLELAVAAVVASVVKIMSDVLVFSQAGSLAIEAFSSPFLLDTRTSSRAGQLAESAAKSMSNRSVDFRNAASDDLTAYGNAFLNNVSVRNKASDVAYNTSESMDQYNNFNISGKNCMVGFINGFGYWVQTLYDNAYAYGCNALASFNNGVGVRSPSWKFRESAMYCIKGAVQGYEDYGYMLENAAEDVGSNSVDVMKEVMSGLDFTDIDNAPVIRPVLDLSNIQNGAGTLNRLLDTEKSISIDTVGAIKMANSIDKQSMETELNAVYNDSDVISSIAQLGERVDALNNAILSMGFYLDGKTFVGGIVKDMDKALGNLSNKKNAGVL